MADQTQPEIQYVQTKNRAIEYELKQKDKGKPYTLQQIKTSNNNHMLNDAWEVTDVSISKT